MAERAIAYLGLGSNLGDREANLVAARDMLVADPAVRVLRQSMVYETQPVGGTPGQPWSLNQVLEIATTLGPGELLARCAEIEASLGRERQNETRWGPRTIDIDLLVHGDARISSPELTVPHPRLAARAFVLVPLAELTPDLSVPGLGRVDQMLKRCGDPHTVTPLR